MALPVERIQRNPKFIALVHTRRVFSWTLSIIMLAIYCVFILVIGFKKELFGTPLGPDTVITWGIPFGVGVILSAFVLTGIYVRRANGEFDRLTREVIEEAQQ
ncbi:MAG: DUF485 domain-containing protein [Candidatus Dactylopiibacterium sp.]|nr:DUF485 domain-containing protein [Candidatus Dactylopiibacterium sp.]